MLRTLTYNADGLVSGWSWASGKAQAIAYSPLARGMVSAYNLGDPNGAGTAAGLRRTLVRDSAGRLTGYTAGVSAFEMERCPPSRWNTVRDDG